MEKEVNIKQNISANLAYYRKTNNFTQLQLAEKINYSDKAISKWERGESIPDIYTLKVLADLYKCKVDDFLKPKTKKKQFIYKNKLIVSLLSIGLVWLITSIVFMVWNLIGESLNLSNVPYWLTWIYGLLSSFIVGLVFANIWWNRLTRCIFVSGIVISSSLIIFLHLTLANIKNGWLVWVVGATFEVLVILWFSLTKKKKEDA